MWLVPYFLLARLEAATYAVTAPFPIRCKGADRTGDSTGQNLSRGVIRIQVLCTSTQGEDDYTRTTGLQDYESTSTPA